MDVPAPHHPRRRALRSRSRENPMYILPIPHPFFPFFSNKKRKKDTEIDWTTYMQHIALYNKGERDYKNITGSTGPLVYPGAHVLIYRVLYWITDQGRNIQTAQYLFALVYLGTLAVVLQCYRKARVCFYLFFFVLFSGELGLKGVGEVNKWVDGWMDHGIKKQRTIAND